MRWVLFSALAWLAALALLAISLQDSAQPTRLSPSASASGLARTLSAMGTAGRVNPPWVVTKASASRRALIVDVEARDPQRAMRIANEIVTPVRAGYTEILIYVRPAGAPAGARVRRIQWTPRGGYVESAF